MFAQPRCCGICSRNEESGEAAKAHGPHKPMSCLESPRVHHACTTRVPRVHHACTTRVRRAPSEPPELPESLVPSELPEPSESIELS